MNVLGLFYIMKVSLYIMNVLGLCRSGKAHVRRGAQSHSKVSRQWLCGMNVLGLLLSLTLWEYRECTTAPTFIVNVLGRLPL